MTVDLFTTSVKQIYFVLWFTELLFFQGIAYIKFSKTSEAALAMEEMNGKCVASDPRPLKVLIAHAKDQVTKYF